MRRFFCLAALALLTSCGGSSTDVVTVRPSVPLVDLLSAPTRPSLGPQRLVGEATLSRPFLIGPEGNPLEVAITVMSEDSEPLSETVEITRLFVVHESAVWETSDVAGGPSGQPPIEILGSASGGPGWGIGSSVDVIVRLRGESEGSFLLRIPGIAIREIE